MSEKAERAAADDDPRKGLGGVVLSMVALWLGSAGLDDVDELPKRVGAATLALWTLVGIALAATLFGVHLALGAHVDNPNWVAVAAPMFLPLLLGTARLPRRRGPALVLAALPGGAVGIVAGLILPTIVGTRWGAFLALSVASLVVSTTYGAIARPDDPAPPSV